MRRHTMHLRLETVVFSLASHVVSDDGKTTMTAGLLGTSDEDSATLVIDSGTFLSGLVDGGSFDTGYPPTP